jgi:hypothetical protein
MRNQLRLAPASSVLATLALVAGCSFSFTTAHITSFVISSDKEGVHAATSFAPGDPIFAKVAIGNAPGKVTLKWGLTADKVVGLAEHSPLPEVDTTYELPRDGTSTYSLTPPPTGWPAGTYSVHVSMLDDSGAEKDKRSGTITVAGSAANAPARAAQAHDAPAERGNSTGVEFSAPEFSDSKRGDGADSFESDTVVIYLHTEFKGVAKGARITATWIAEKADGVAPETKIVSSDVIVGAQDNEVDFSVTKPAKGWPSGSYRVDISVEGKVVQVGRFDIED